MLASVDNTAKLSVVRFCFYIFALRIAVRLVGPRSGRTGCSLPKVITQ